MIVDQIHNAKQYELLNPRFPRAFDFLRETDLASLEPGRLELDQFSVVVYEGESRGTDGARLERHEKMVDIHHPVRGSWKSVDKCHREIAPFEYTRDVGKFEDVPDMWVPIPEGTFAICFPGDAHAPLGGDSEVKKLILKIPT